MTAMLGRPTSRDANTITFQWLSRKPMTPAEIQREAETFKTPVSDPFFDVLDTIKATFTGGRASEIDVNHVETF
jgi:hypothetical protein